VNAMIPAEAKGAWPVIAGHVRRYLARRVPPSDVDDLVQDVLLRVHRGLPGLTDDRRFGPWVYRIAARAVADWHARRDRPLPSVEDFGAPELDADDIGVQLAGCVGVFVARLPDPYREAIALTELEGLTQKAAADRLQISVSGVKSRVQRGRARLRAMLEACCALSFDRRRRLVRCEPRDARARVVPITEGGCGCRGAA
jgi:RNA polymerase sigma-70 factor (ECF subfamily)